MGARNTAAILSSVALVSACGGSGTMSAAGAAGAKGEEAGADAGIAADPLAEPNGAPLVLRFAYNLEEELSCSQSFESDGASARYELVLEPSGEATLTVLSDASHAFGPSDARFRPGSGDEITREQSGADRTWRGSFTWKGRGFAAALSPEGASCKTLVAGKGWYMTECAPGAPLEFACARATVRALPPFAAEPGAGGAEPLEAVEVLECAPAFGLPAEGALDVDLPAALPFAPPPGLELEYWRHGIGNLDALKLRRVAVEKPLDLRLD